MWLQQLKQLVELGQGARAWALLGRNQIVAVVVEIDGFGHGWARGRLGQLLLLAPD